MSGDRDAYAAAQSELLAALHGRADVPDGFSAAQVQTAATSLLRKRRGELQAAWPGLVHELGADFEGLFASYARRVPPPPAGAGLVDGLRFTAALERGRLGDAGRVELAFARAAWSLRGGVARPRRGLYGRAHLLRRPPRVLLVLRLPGLGVRSLVLPPHRHR